MSMNNVPTVSTSDIPEMIRLSAALRVALMIWGPPGVGKSALVKAFADSINGLLVDIRLSQYDQVDMRGLPDSNGNKTVWLMPSTMPFKGSDFPTDKPIVLFMDEVMQASPALQSVAFQLMHSEDRAVGEHKLLDNVIVVGASNRDTDRAGAKTMLTPLANRMMHINVESNNDAFRDWGMANGLHPLVMGYLNFRPENQSQFTEACKASVKAFPTERSWETVSNILKSVENRRLRDMAVSATVGSGVAGELMAFIDVYESLPKWQTIVDNPSTAPVPDYGKRDVLCAVCTLITSRIDSQTGDKLVTYIKRLPKEYQTMVASDLTRGANTKKLAIQCPDLAKLVMDLDREIHS